MWRGGLDCSCEFTTKVGFLLKMGWEWGDLIPIVQAMCIQTWRSWIVEQDGSKIIFGRRIWLKNNIRQSWICSGDAKLERRLTMVAKLDSR